MSVDALGRNEPFDQKRSVLGAIRSWFQLLVAARECGAAVEMGERPSDRALIALGIDPVQFAKIKLR